MKRMGKVWIVTAVLSLGAAGFVAVFFSKEAISRERFDLVTVGMTEASVRNLMGIPQVVRSDSSHSTVYFYGGFPKFRWCTVEIFFGADGLVTGKFHDH